MIALGPWEVFPAQIKESVGTNSNNFEIEFRDVKLRVHYILLKIWLLLVDKSEKVQAKISMTHLKRGFRWSFNQG